MKIGITVELNKGYRDTHTLELVNEIYLELEAPNVATAQRMFRVLTMGKENVNAINLSVKEDIQKEGIVIKGHSGTWHILETWENKQYLLEHEQYGCDVNLLLTDDKFNWIKEVDQDTYYDLKYDK